MHQETHSPNATSKTDLLLAIGLFAAACLAGVIMRLARALSPWAALLLFLLVAVGVYFLYRMRLRSFRYTLCYRNPEEDAEDFGDLPPLPYPLHSLTLERLSSGKTDEILTLRTKDLLTLHETLPSQDAKPFALRRKGAVLVSYRQDGEVKRLFFSPSPELMELIENEMGLSHV